MLIVKALKQRNLMFTDMCKTCGDNNSSFELTKDGPRCSITSVTIHIKIKLETPGKV